MGHLARRVCVWFFRFFFSNKFSVGKSKTFMEFLLQHVYCQQKWGPPRLKMRAICIDTPIIGFDNVKPCVTFTTSMAAFFTLQHVRSNKILQKMLLWCQKWILQESRCTSNYLQRKKPLLIAMLEMGNNNFPPIFEEMTGKTFVLVWNKSRARCSFVYWTMYNIHINGSRTNGRHTTRNESAFASGLSSGISLTFGCSITATWTRWWCFGSRNYCGFSKESSHGRTERYSARNVCKNGHGFTL